MGCVDFAKHKRTIQCHTPFNKCPIFDLFVFKYAREVFEIRGWHGNRSTTQIPAFSSCRTFSGLFESKRIRCAPSRFNIAPQKS